MEGETKGLENGIPCGPEGSGNPECPECVALRKKAELEEELNFAVLIALIPAMVFSLVNFTGLV